MLTLLKIHHCKFLFYLKTVNLTDIYDNILFFRLREINFGDCLLRNSGVLHLSKALKANHLNLEVVNLGYNEIELDGALCLVDALSNKPKLKKLNLDGNNVGIEVQIFYYCLMIWLYKRMIFLFNF